MVERRPWLDFLSHAILIIGVLIVAFPIYITFVASTHTADAVVQSPMPLLPGSHLLDNYATALGGERQGSGSHASVGRMMVVSLIGWNVAGIPGALVATLAVAGPSSVLTYLVAGAWYRFKDAPWRKAIQLGLMPVTAGLLLATGLARAVGLGDHLVSPSAGKAAVWWNGLHGLPEGLLLGMPTDVMAIAHQRP